MIDTKGSNLIFLLCVPRSGSSLATYMLQNHPAIVAMQEMWFLMSLYDLRTPSEKAYGGAAILSRFFNGMLTDDMFVRACRAFASNVYGDFMQSSNGRYMLDKSPRYYYLLEFLDRIFPHSKRIMLVRNPLDIAASYKKAHAGSSHPLRIEEQLVQSAFDVKAADLTVGLFRYAHYFADAHPLAYRLSYEALVNNPREQLRELCSFIGVQYEEGMEQYGEYKHTSKSDLFFSMGVGDPHMATYDAPHTRSIGKWQETLTKREVETLCQVIGAQYFYDNGYAEQLEAAEQITGVRFSIAPDLELIERRSEQMMKLTGCTWTPNYRMVQPSDSMGAVQQRSMQQANEEHRDENKLLQMEITLRAAEQRLQHVYEERDRILKRYKQLQAKVERVKAYIPFSRSIARWANARLGEEGKQS